MSEITSKDCKVGMSDELFQVRRHHDGRMEVEGVKHDTGKPDLSMVPLGLVEGCARAMMFGVGKYGRDNWRGGFADSRLLAACLRHIMAYTNGERIDAESGLCHLDCAAFSLGVVLDQIRRREMGHDAGRDDLHMEQVKP